VSVGVARFPADGTSADELIGAAQRALAAARESGPGKLAEATAQPTG
jgi:GGDEF domain-containing protein